MKFESFRELLIKKAEGDPALQALIKYSRDEIIVDQVLETLEKMARASHKGDAANFPVRDFGTEMDPETEPHMIRDALGHHVSRYKAALGAKRPELANQHARQAFKLMNMADIAQKHSGGKLSIEHVSPHPWERNKFTSQYDAAHPKVQEGKYKPGDFVTKTKGLNYKGTDFSFLNQAPHESYKSEIKRHGHNGAYPFEQIRINGKYIPVDEKVDLKGYEEHPFDRHPIMNHFDTSAKNRKPEEDQQYVQQRDAFYNESPHIGKFWEGHEQRSAANPEAYSGEQAAAPVHGEGPKLDLGGDEPAKQATPAAKGAPAKAAPANKVDSILSQLSPEDRAEIEKLLSDKGDK